jgi:N-acetylmuramoyl-L-alanine amidase
VVFDLASRIEGRLAAVGVTAVLTHGRLDPDALPPTDAERARLANEVDADLVLSLHTDGSANPAAQGVATFYYGAGRHGVHSVVGEAFADLLQAEVVARTDLLDGHTDAKTWELLRGTRMPAVRLEVGYLTHAGDAARLADPQFRDAVAEAVLVSLQHLYLPQDPAVVVLDPPVHEPVG